MDKFKELLKVYGNLMFDCGQFNESFDSISEEKLEEYRDLSKRAELARQAVIDGFENNVGKQKQ